MTVIAETPPAGPRSVAPRFLWLDLTRKCQLSCTHCHNESGPDGTHGTMSAENWRGVLDEAAALGIPDVQFTGGEVTLHPDAPGLIEHALALGLRTEVYSNLVHVPEIWWALLRRTGVSLATSYYSAVPGRHNAVTQRPSHARTRANILKAIGYGIPIRVSVIVTGDADSGDEARQELAALGAERVRIDRVRPFGRGANGRQPDTGGLCGRCGTGRASIGPGGVVSPCVFSTWLRAGSVQDSSLAAILGGPEMAYANAAIRTGQGGRAKPCGPDDNDDECSPGFPGSECTPRN